MARLEIRGSAPALTLSAPITAGSATLQVTGTITNWPTGVTYDFEVVVDRGTANEEHILCTSLTPGTPNLLGVTTRGYNGTTAVAHSASAKVEHFVSATLIDDLEDHVYRTTRDDHAQYIKTDGTRGFSAVPAIVGTPVSIGAAISAGTAVTLARSDHVHNIPDNFIPEAKYGGASVSARALAANSVTAPAVAPNAIASAAIQAGAIQPTHISPDSIGQSQIAPGGVGPSELAASAVGTPAIADTSLTLAKFAANLRPTIICTSSTRPTGVVEGQQIYETDTNFLNVFDGTNWVTAVPRRMAADVGVDRDVAAGGNVVHMSAAFTLTQQRMVKGTTHCHWRQITGAGNNSESCSIGFDGAATQRFVAAFSPAINDVHAGSDQIWAVLAPGAHTLDVKVINSSSGGGAMRLLAADASWAAAEDWGPA